MFPLLILLPVAVLFITGVGVIILQQTRPSIGYAWVMASIGALLVLGSVLFLRWQIPLEVTIEPWRAFGEYSTAPAFRMDLSSWPYLLCLAALALAFLFTDSSRLETDARPINWSAGLSITGLAMLAVMAANPLTLLLAWTAVDVVEFSLVMATKAGRRLGEQTVRLFSVRLAGSLLVVFAILVARSRDIVFTLNPIPEPLAFYMLLAAGLRLGVLPLNVHFTREVYGWRGLGTVIRMIGPASSLVVLGHMPEQVVPLEWRLVLFALVAVAALYGAAMWFTSNSELHGRPYWSTALAALAVASVLNGDPYGSIAWGAVLILSGSVLFLFSARRRQILFLPGLALLGLLGLPFTPASAGWQGSLSQSPLWASLLFIFAALFLAWGYVRHVLRPRDELYRMERWVHVIYPAGLMVLVLAQWAIVFLGRPGLFTAGIWWASLGMTFMAGLGVALAFSFQRNLTGDVLADQWLVVFALRAGSMIGSVLRLNWFYQFLAWGYRVLQSVVQLLTGMFEGDGGILWSLVMLALLITMITTGGTP
jgi:hypothetical protein